MKYIRRYQSNIYNNDRFSQRKIDVDRLEDESFEVKEFKIYTSTYSLVFSDKNAEEIVESLNFFTIRNKDKFISIKWSLVEKIEFTVV